MKENEIFSRYILSYFYIKKSLPSNFHKIFFEISVSGIVTQAFCFYSLARNGITGNVQEFGIFGPSSVFRHYWKKIFLTITLTISKGKGKNLNQTFFLQNLPRIKLYPS